MWVRGCLLLGSGYPKPLPTTGTLMLLGLVVVVVMCMGAWLLSTPWIRIPKTTAYYQYLDASWPGGGGDVWYGQDVASVRSSAPQ